MSINQCRCGAAIAATQEACRYCEMKQPKRDPVESTSHNGVVFTYSRYTPREKAAVMAAAMLSAMSLGR